ncbi:MAG TPA: hypothetical protein VK034_10390, partial [Enhygromyxa sp.]|nr:hypothetical protein [Enhygromyxa sp.]
SCDAAPPQSVGALATVEGPISSSSGKMFYEPDSGWLILFGGLREVGTYDDAVLAIEPETLTTHILDWAAGPSFEMTSVSAAADPYQPRWWFVGGEHGQGLETEVLEVRLDGDLLSAEQLPALPSEVVDHGVGYDPESGRLLYVLGWDGHPPDTDYREQTWVLRPDAPASQWQLLPDAGGPPGQRDADLVHVPTQGLFLLAHLDSDDEELTGIWQLRSDSEVWEPRALDLQPIHVGRSRLFWDQPSCRLIVWTDGYWIDVDVVTPAIFVIDPFTDPMTVVPIERPQAAPTYGRNAGYDPVHRIVIEHGGTDYSGSDSVYMRTIESFSLE